MLGVNDEKTVLEAVEQHQAAVLAEHDENILPNQAEDPNDLGRICSEELSKVGGQVTDSVVSDLSKTLLPPVQTSQNSNPSIFGNRGSVGSQPQMAVPFPHNPPQPVAPKAPGQGAVCPYESTCKISHECRTNSGRCGLMPTKLAESYYGYVETVEDAVMIVEACRFGRLMRVKRRLLEKERQGIRSGSVFVFVERESGIRRWTDGKVWSPSRICGEFLIYRELESRQPPATRKPSQPAMNWTEQVAKFLAAKTKSLHAATAQQQQQTEQLEPSAKMPKTDEEAEEEEDEDTEEDTPEAASNAANNVLSTLRAVLTKSQSQSDTAASLSQSATGGSKAMVFKKDGLIKKTISLTVSDETYHLICYFKDSNLGSELLHLTPSRMAAFKNLDICRNPVSYPIMMLQSGMPATGSFYQQQPPPQHQRPQAMYQPYHQQQQHPTQFHQHHPQQPYSYANAGPPPQRRIVPTANAPLSIANGSVQLPPVVVNPQLQLQKQQQQQQHQQSQSKSLGIANLLSPETQPDLECLSSNCASNCGSCSGSCSRRGSLTANLPPAEEVKDETALAEEQLLFCHFLESVRNEQ